MTEQNAEYKADETTDKTVDVSPAPAQAEPTERNSGRHRSGQSQWVLWLLVIALGGALGASYWQQTLLGASQGAALQQMQQNYQALQQSLQEARSGMQSELQSQVALLENSASTLESAMDELQRVEQQDAIELLALQQGFERQLQETRTLVSALQRQLASLQQRDTRWLNAEAAYLMRLANYKVSVEHDVPTAVQLLQTVEGLLSDQLDPAARTALINVVSDRASLQNINAPDKMTLIAQVDGLRARLSEISISAIHELNYQQGVREARQQTTELAQAQGWSAALMNLLRSIFVWRQTDFGALAFVSPDQEILMKQQLGLLFEQAKIAIVQADQAQFELALGQVAAGVDNHFAQDSELARELLADIEQFRSQKIAPELPDISGSLVLVEQLVEPLPEPVDPDMVETEL